MPKQITVLDFYDDIINVFPNSRDIIERNLYITENGQYIPVFRECEDDKEMQNLLDAIWMAYNIQDDLILVYWGW